MDDTDNQLTLTYGSLVWRLEGFDDPFNVVRDVLDRLAADGRPVNAATIRDSLPTGLDCTGTGGAIRLCPGKVETGTALRLGEARVRGRHEADGTNRSDAADVPAWSPTYRFPPADPPPGLAERAGGGFAPAVDVEPDTADRHLGTGTVERLMDEADAQIEAHETRRRTRAVAHMRRAVAATRAESALAPPDERRDLSDFRRDLRDAVRPLPLRQPERPLRLGADRRVDGDAAEPLRLGEGRVPRADLAERLEGAARAAGPDGLDRAALLAIAGKDTTASKTDWLAALGLLLREERLHRVSGGCFVARASADHSSSPGGD